MQKLCVIAEDKIKNDLKMTGSGSIMYDAWSNAGVHYVGLFAYYMKKVQIINKGKEDSQEEPGITSLSCAPMSKLLEN